MTLSLTLARGSRWRSSSRATTVDSRPSAGHIGRIPRAGFIFAVATMVLLSGVIPVSAQSLTYLGRVRMPETNNAFSAGGLTLRTHPSGYRELLSLDASGRVFGVRLPSSWNDSIATGYVLYGTPQVPSGHRIWNIGMDHAGELLVFHAPFYPAAEASTLQSITRYTITANALTNKRGPFAIPGVHFHRRQGGSFVLPDAVAAKYGGRKTVVGFGGAYNIIQGGSTGTAAYAVDPNTFSSAAPLVEFPWGVGANNERRRGDYFNVDTADPATRNPVGAGNYDGFWTFTDSRAGAAWAGGLWTVGTEATGRLRYGNEAGESGFHSDAFKTFIRFYPEAQLDSVRTGALSPQATRPAYWRLGEIPGVPAWLATQLNIDGTARVSPESRVNGLVIEGDILIVGGPFAWGGTYNEYPAVYAFRIGGGTPAPGPPPPPPPPPPNEPQACTVSTWSTWQATSGWSACSGGRQTRTERRTRSILTPPTNGGAACPALEETRTATRSCAGPAPAEVCSDGLDNDGDGLVDENCSPNASPLPGPPRKMKGRVIGNIISLDWAAPITGGKVTGYVLEAGTAAGTTALQLPVKGTSFKTSVPSGKFFVRVRALNNGGRSTPSNEVVVTAGCNSQPRQPRALSAKTAGTKVSLQWVDDDGCNDSYYRLDVGSSQGGANILSAPLSSPLVTAAAPPGTYFARVVTVSPFGVTAPSADVKMVVPTPATCQPPTFETDLEVQMAGRWVSMQWSPSNDAAAFAADDLSPIEYVIEVGSASGRTDVLRVPVGRTTGLLTPAPPGTYFVRVRPADMCGVGRASNEFVVQVR